MVYHIVAYFIWTVDNNDFHFKTWVNNFYGLFITILIILILGFLHVLFKWLITFIKSWIFEKFRRKQTIHLKFIKILKLILRQDIISRDCIFFSIFAIRSFRWTIFIWSPYIYFKAFYFGNYYCFLFDFCNFFSGITAPFFFYIMIIPSHESLIANILISFCLLIIVIFRHLHYIFLQYQNLFYILKMRKILLDQS